MIKTDYDETSDKNIPRDIARMILNLITNAFYPVNKKRINRQRDINLKFL